MNIIVTGFEPFLDNEINPTLEVLKLLPKNIEGHNIITVRLPVLYDQCFDVLKPYIIKYNPGKKLENLYRLYCDKTNNKKNQFVYLQFQKQNHAFNNRCWKFKN